MFFVVVLPVIHTVSKIVGTLGSKPFRWTGGGRGEGKGNFNWIKPRFSREISGYFIGGVVGVCRSAPLIFLCMLFYRTGAV